ncbi:hypothetical protein EBN88_19280, partial [Streptomyces triticirhizae]
MATVAAAVGAATGTARSTLAPSPAPAGTAVDTLPAPATEEAAADRPARPDAGPVVIGAPARGARPA